METHKRMSPHMTMFPNVCVLFLSLGVPVRSASATLKDFQVLFPSTNGHPTLLQHSSGLIKQIVLQIMQNRSLIDSVITFQTWPLKAYLIDNVLPHFRQQSFSLCFVPCALCRSKKRNHRPSRVTSKMVKNRTTIAKRQSASTPRIFDR